MDLPPADMIKQFKVEIDKKKAAHTWTSFNSSNKT
jgi:hypothetical protein